MSILIRTGALAIVAVALCLSLAAAADDLRGLLTPENIDGLRINLLPGGAQLGFEAEIAGGDPRIEGLAEVLREAEPGGGHKCANAGAIRFRLKDGSLIGVGLLPSHTEGLYEFRLYDGDRFVATYRADRADLLAALEILGVPVDDPAFRE